MRLRWGVLSTANIGLTAVIPALQAAHSGEVVAIASRDQGRAEKAASNLSIPAAYGSYGDLLAAGNVDAVYIPLPNSLHKPWTLAALRAGKHVLCEKPLGLDAQEATEMAELADERGLKLMEAFMYRFHPRIVAVQELLRQGVIGELRLIRSSFTFNLKRVRPGDIRWNPALGGGALYDVGCYCVNASRLLTDEEPDEVYAQARWTARGVDEQLVATLAFPGGVIAQFDCGLAADSREGLELVGTSGILDIPHAFTTVQNDAIIIERHQGQENIIHRIPGTNQYQLMTEHFAAAILYDTPLRYPVADAVANMQVIDQLYESAKAKAYILSE